MYLREAPQITIANVHESLNTQLGREHSLVTQTQHLSCNLTAETPHILDALNHREFPVTQTGLEAFAGWLDVPSKFLKRVDPEMQQYILTHLLSNNPGEVGVVYNENGILELRDAEKERLDVRLIAEVADRVVGSNALVLDWWNNPSEFHLDVVVPAEISTSSISPTVGGDLAEGDITCGGLRFNQNRKRNLAPTVEQLLYRLVCTNGLSEEDPTEKVDARGKTPDEIISELEIIADRLFFRTAASIRSFYDLRTVPVESPERLVRRLGQENALPERVRDAIEDAIPTITNEHGQTNMFDLVNLVTNHANEPGVSRSFNERRRLERVGARVVSDHASRCPTCQSRLGG